LPVMVCLPLMLALLAMKQWFEPHTYIQLLTHLAVAGTVYGLALWWAFASKRALKVGSLHSPGAMHTAGPVVETFSQEI